MAEEVIGLLFGVDGGGSIDGRSGQQIVSDLTKIVNQINSGKSTVPKVQLKFDTSHAKKAIAELKTQLQEIASIANKITISETPEQKAQKSNYSKKIASIKEYYAALKEIQSLQNKGLGGLSRGDNGMWSTTDQDHYGKRVANLNTLLKEYQEIINVVGNSELSEAQKAKALGVSTQQYTQIVEANTRAVNENAIAKERMSSSKFEGDASSEQQNRYNELTNTVKQYYSALAEVEKIQLKSTEVSSSGGVWSTTDPQYDARIKKINDLESAFKELEMTQKSANDVEISSASKLNITEEQRALLIKQIRSEMTANGIAQEKSTAQISAAWDKNAAKVHEYILRIQEVASKNPEVNALMKELNTLAASGDPRNLDKLTDKFAELQQKVRETDADVETFWQKLKKTFGSQLRSMLASMVYMQLLKFLRDIYHNVVELDKATANLQIASGKTRKEAKELTKNYAALAQQLGATTMEVAEAADTWLRQGYAADESNTLIKNSTMLSRLGQIEAAEASTALTSAMRGYKVSVKDSITIVDKLTAVDMEAAASAGGMATAMSETAASADIAGVSMDKLIGYIATVKEVTQDGDESVGTFYKTLFARMNNVKAGKFVDDETGEALNDVEKVLNELGISLRDADKQFRNSGEVLDEVAGKWKSFDSTAQHAIATAFSGTRQQEKFIVLMENYGAALRYTEVSANSAGTAAEKFSAYTDSIEGKMNSLKASFEKFSITLVDSDLIVGVIDFLSLIMNGVVGVGSLVDALGGLPTALLAVATVLVAVNGGLIAYNAQMKITAAYKAILLFFTKLKRGLMNVVTAIPNAIVAWKAYAAGIVSASTAMQGSIPIIGLVLAAVTLLAGSLALLNGAQDEYAQKTKESAEAAATLSDEITELTYKYLKLVDAVNMDDASKESLLQTQEELLKKLKLEKDEIDELIKKYGSYTEALKKAAIEQLTMNERDLRGGLKTTKDELIHEAGESTFGDNWMELSTIDSVGLFSYPDKGHYDSYAALKALEDAGYISSGSYSVYTDEHGKKYSQGFALYQRHKYDMSVPEGVVQAYNDLGAMLDVVGDAAGQDNFVYEAFYKEYNEMSGYVSAYKTNVGNLNDNLAQQYTLTGLIGKEMPKTKDEFEKYRQEVINSAISSEEFVGSNEDVADAIDSVLSEQSAFADFYNVSASEIKGVTVALKSAKEILEEVQDGYDGLSNAIGNLTSEGYLNADSLATILGLIKDNNLAGLTLEDVLIRDANGYKLVDNALQKFVQAVIQANAVTKSFATQQDKDNNIANLRMLQAVLATLAQTQADSTDAIKAQREELEKQQDTYNDQLDSYRELIDIRKDLLSTYEEELSYQKELTKRQRNVTQLQTKLAVAQLDTSAAGQARVRELESELRDAQDDLEDFTLEHAIDVLQNQLESQYAEYESFIKSKLNEITTILEGLDATPEVNVNIDSSWVHGVISQIESLITDAQNKDIVNLPSESLSPKARWTSFEDAANDGYGNIRKQNEFARGGDDRRKYGTYQAYLDVMYEKYIGKKPVYHDGGIVGEISTLRSTEEFAKLLKGEFVSTPAQMKQFMEKTLPYIANYQASNGTNEFNAPLIEIVCESVTSESIPELKRVVDEAVKEVKRQLDSGMSRTGYKRSVKTI